MRSCHPVASGLIAGVLLAGASNLAGAQVFEARIGRFYDSRGWTAYRAGFTRPISGILSAQVHGDYFERVGDPGGFAGVGSDLTLFRGGEGPYLVAGLSGGLGSENSNEFSSW